MSANTQGAVGHPAGGPLVFSAAHLRSVLQYELLRRSRRKWWGSTEGEYKATLSRMSISDTYSDITSAFVDGLLRIREIEQGIEYWESDQQARIDFT